MARQILTASSLGAVLDCDLTTGNKIGGGTATDNTTLLNTVLASATASNPIHLVLDGPCLTTGLVIPTTGYVTLEGRGLDTGIFMKNGSNNHCIQSAHTLSAPGVGWWNAIYDVKPSTRGANVAVKNMTINGNRPGNSTSGDLRMLSSGQWLVGLWLMNLDHVLLENLYVWNVPSFYILFDNCGDVVCEKIHTYDPLHVVNSDGIHIDGPGNDYRISDCFFENNGDDAIALNAPEGFSGDISRVTVTNCIFKNTLTMSRIYSLINSSSTGKVDNVAFTNCVGYCASISLSTGTVLRLGNGGTGQTNVDWVRHISMTNCRFSAPWWVDMLGDPVGDLEINDCTWHTSGNSAVNFSAGTTVNHILFNNFTIYRDINSNSCGLLQVNHSSSSVSRLTLQGIRVVNQIGQSYSAISWLLNIPSGGTLNHLQLDGIDPTLIASLMGTDGFTNVASVSGTACSASGFQFPDSVMLDGVVYLSSDASGAPSIKVSGSPKRFTIT